MCNELGRAVFDSIGIRLFKFLRYTTIRAIAGATGRLRSSRGPGCVVMFIHPLLIKNGQGKKFSYSRPDSDFFQPLCVWRIASSAP